MRIFLTGASGFIGRHLTRHLSMAGHEVSVLVRQGVRHDLSESVRAVFGTLADVERWQDTLGTCDALIHLAARYRIGEIDRRDMVASNIEGTQRVLRAAWHNGVGRIVHVSSTAALGETFGTLEDETRCHNGRFRSFYEQTKHVAHGLAEQMQHRGAPLMIAIPGGVFGPGDRSDLANALAQFVQGGMHAQVASMSRFQLCPVEAMCGGLRRIVEHGTCGRNYLLTGQTVSMEGLVARAAAICGRPVPRKLEPERLRWPALLCDALRPLGIRTPLSREALQVMDGSSYLYSSARAEAELGWPWQDIRNAFEAHFEAYVRSLQTIGRHS